MNIHSMPNPVEKDISQVQPNQDGILDINTSTNTPTNTSSLTRISYQSISQSVKDVFVRLVVTNGQSVVQAASITGINKNTGYSIIMNFRRNGELIVNRRGGARRIKLTPQLLCMIEQEVERNPGATLEQIRAAVSTEEMQICKSSVENALGKLAITLKKARVELDRVNSPSGIALRRDFALDFSRCAPVERTKCVYVDECGFNLHLRRSQARSSIGTRAPIVIPTVRGRNVTLIAAMSSAGIIFSKLIDDGAVNKIKFNTFMTELVVAMNGRNDMAIYDMRGYTYHP